MRNKRIIISGGGTGGHIFPAISVANALRRIEPGTDILFVGAEGRMEMEKVPAAGYRIRALPVSGFYRQITFRNFSVLLRLIRSLSMAKRIIREFRPDVALGVGGFASGPVMWKAAGMGIPVVIQEQNSYAGVTNRLLAKRASAICVAYDGMEKYFPRDKIIKTGNPVRHSFDNSGVLKNEALEYFGFSREKQVVLVLGGSLGAGTINKTLGGALDRMAGSGLQWLWQTGMNYYEDVKSLAADSLAETIAIHGFIDRMDYAFAAADIIVSRAGAGTISELCLVGKPVILVPSPNVAEDHQTRNAEALSGNGAAILIADSQAEKKLIDEVIRLSLDTSGKAGLSENIRKMAERDSDIRIANEVLKLAGT
ncbi:MAG TPA: undecaprenyldiphospho-muramoylpentapeptide beta-N-acetylglucosaminyltransferase [Bacteroidales bacterium]|nr:undecaprenyldiphospho-muramoylpentapeptide beta-N-acetylglucosaminyltransferase [Bacteroidales bacterium]HOS71275.1 undecaprenyldiphospho-muramoylpentapeptide beta-N-acetylglucosaminyltransferase [Bacteroidales bacterium]HQH24062.1 undecaprenyldiphospho-muramoylpentapeptide beta-N-acetylglucosaminyltransferase [Bacteroidales bacterium]HQJ83016.1 undecaprenyldiphospho-muramoylpentapeptide beta-N-acetylglucosaminyltransferase [Bacteroidales bacterium]